MATLKQKKVAKILAENGRKSVSAAMREAGYSNSTATKPDKLTRSKGWQELAEELFDKEHIIRRIQGLVDADVIINVKETTKGEVTKQVQIIKQDTFARKNGIDIALKMTSGYAPMKIKMEDPLADLSDEEVESQLAILEKRRQRYLQSKTSEEMKKSKGTNTKKKK